jgi:biopolymer transport protein ExbD
MRRFSQRSALVTLSEINITPLLDLAFVLLIIFVITTPLLDQGIKLPSGGKPDKQIEKRDIRTVEISSKGAYMIERRPMLLEQVEALLIKESHANPNLIVYVRADENSRWKEVIAMFDLCQRNGIKISARTEPPKRQ